MAGFYENISNTTVQEAAEADALASKNAASVSEANAASSAANAATSEANAATSATNAASSETSVSADASAASASAASALASKNAAETAKTNAETAETNAETAETNAASSATSAANSASTATTKASEASTSASNAATSETNAASSATSASGSATTATTKASEASTSASNASTSENNAASSASSASASETSALASKNAASTSESNAATSATNAATSATNSASSATASSNSASSATTAQSAAEAARDAALAAFDSFDDRYLGQKASNPSTDNDGNTLVAGTLYFNTTTDEMKVYDGSQWLNAYASLSGALLATSNLSDLNNAGTARTNLGLGTAATTASTDYATAAQGTKVDGIEASADVTDTANVTAAGALMDSELTSEASVKALNQGVATGDSPTFAGLTVGDGVSSKQILVDAGAGWADLKLHSDATNGGSIYFNDGADAGQIFYYHPENSMRFLTNASERMRIDGSGNAIFTKSGGAYLQLKDASAVRGAINVTNSDGLVFTTGSSFTERMRITDSGVGIGTSSPVARLEVHGAFPYSGTVTSLSTSVTKASARIRGSSDASTSLYFGSLGNDAEQYIQSSNDSGTGADEIALNPYGGNVLVGQTSNAETGTGIGLVPDGTSHMYSGGTDALMLGRGGSDGDILSFNKSGTTVGSVSTLGGDFIVGSSSGSGAAFRMDGANNQIYPSNATGSARDNAVNLGASTVRFKDLYLSGRITSNQPSTCFTSSSNITLYNDGNWRKIALNSTKHQTGGNHFNSSNNRFTAPVAGRYLFGMDIQLESVSGTITWMYIVPLVNGTIGANNGQAFADFSPPNSTYNRRTGTFLLNLSANDYVEMWQIGAGNGTAVLKANTESSFFLTLL